MKLLQKKLDKVTAKGSNVYIVPSLDGFKYIFINFTLFLIALSYANNMALIITFLMVAYLILQMLDIHRIIQETHYEEITITDDFISSNIYALIRLKDKIPSKFATTQIEFQLESGEKLNADLDQIIDDFNFRVKIHIAKRGRYDLKRVKVFTYGNTKLFYVWRYFQSPRIFYVYPEKVSSRENTSAAKNESHINLTEEEFSNHIPYIKGLNSKRIDWKVFARKDQLYWKKHIDYNSQTIDVNFNKLHGDTEDRIKAMSFLIDKCYKAGTKWRLVLPTKIIETTQGIKHYKESMESISEYK